MGKIIFVTNLSGKKEVIDDIAKIVAKAKAGDKSYQAVSHYIMQALHYLKDIKVDENDKKYFHKWKTTDVWEPTRELEIKIVLKAISQPSVFEFRINWEPLYFRALFFVDDVNKEQYKFMARSLLKEEKNPPELQQKINETEWVSQMYNKNPSKYLKEWS